VLRVSPTDRLWLAFNVVQSDSEAADVVWEWIMTRYVGRTRFLMCV